MTASDHLGLQFNYLANDSDFHQVQASTSEGTPVGSLSWAKPSVDDNWMVDPGEVKNIHVHPDFRGQGIASNMWQHAKSIDPGIRHSTSQTEAGSGWARSVGA